MSIDNRVDRVSMPSLGEQPNEAGLNLLSVQPERPVQVASLGLEAAMLASRAMLGCDPLFDAQKECRALQDHLRNNPDVRDPKVGRMIEHILNNGLRNGQAPLEMRVERLNDYLKDVGVKASLNKAEDRLTLVNETTGAKVVYAVGRRSTQTPRQ